LSFLDRIATEGKPEIARAINRRFTELAEQDLRRNIGSPGAEASLVERVQEALRVYEEGLSAKHGRRQPAGRLRPMIERWGEKEAVRRLVATHDNSAGLDFLNKMERLDCAFEQIILDLAGEYDNDLQLLAAARANLTRLTLQRTGSASRPHGRSGDARRRGEGLRGRRQWRSVAGAGSRSRSRRAI
jgi:hypothetical protein